MIEGREFDFAHHEYLKGLYADEGSFLVIRKAAQMGASEFAISKALHFVITKGGRVIYYFPSDTDVADFSQDRFAPAVLESDYLRGLVRNTDTIGLKHIGDGSIYFRGTKSRNRAKSVPADFLIFDELDEMDPARVELARKRLGHSSYGWELALSTPSFPEYGIDAAFVDTDQRHWLLRCSACATWWCLEDEFLEHHGSPSDPRSEICFIKGRPGEENLVCMRCGKPLDPSTGQWVKKYERPAHGYQLSKFASVIVSERERNLGSHTKPAALLAEWQRTQFPAEFFASELGLPCLAADGGVTEAQLLALVADYPQQASGKGCVMGVDQGNGLHLVIKMESEDGGLAFTLRVHYEPQTDATFSHLDHYMEAFDVRACVIDAQPNIHAARSFAQRYPGRVFLAYYGPTQRGLTDWGRDQEHTPTVTIARTEAFDGWRDNFEKARCRLPRADGEVKEYIKQMTNILRSVREDPTTGEQRARWIRRGPDHYAHADSFAQIALKRMHKGGVKVSIIG